MCDEAETGREEAGEGLGPGQASEGRWSPEQTQDSFMF